MRLWPGDTFVDFDHGLNAAVNKLRESLCDSADSPRFIETLPRRGYRFVAAVEPLGEPYPQAPPLPADGAAARNGRPSARTESAAASPEAPAGKRTANVWRSPVAWALAVALIVAGLAITAKNKSLRPARADTVSSILRMRTFTEADEDAAQPSFSPDGARLAFTRWGIRPEDSGIFVKTVEGGRQIQLTSNQRDESPVWSPDGTTLAFSRWHDPDFALLTVPAKGGTAQKLDTRGHTVKGRELDWSPDGKWIAFRGEEALYLLSLGDGSVLRLTNPSPSAEDRAPAFSAASDRVLFVRSRGGGIPEEIRTVALDGGEEELITAVTADILGTPRWSAGGDAVVFSSNFGGKAGLWRVSTTRRGSPVQIGDSAADPAVARQGGMLAYERGSRGLNIWQLDFAGGGKPAQTILLPMTGQTDQGPAPQISPDGGKLAFMSDRSGTMEIWVASADGKNPRQLTAVGNAGTPRWSPDSKAIVFDANRKNGSSIYTVSLEGGEARLLTVDDFENRCPSWSRDGKWIYFASRRTGRFEVWKAPAAGGAPIEVTRNGGHAALESPDGKHIYYAKTPLAYPEIWQAEANGGGEKLLSRDVRPAMWATWAVVDAGTKGGILFAQPSGTGAPVVTLFDLATRRSKNLGQIGIVPFWLGASRDGTKVVFDQPGWQQSQIMLVENFR